MMPGSMHPNRQFVNTMGVHSGDDEKSRNCTLRTRSESLLKRLAYELSILVLP